VFKLTSSFGVSPISQFEFSAPSLVIGDLPERFMEANKTVNHWNQVKLSFKTFPEFKKYTEDRWGNLAKFFRGYFDPLIRKFDSSKNEAHFVIYCSKEDFLQILLCIWKEAYIHASEKDLWDLYVVYANYSKFSDNIAYLHTKDTELFSSTFDEFSKAYKEAPAIGCTREELAAMLSLNDLLASYYYDDKNPMIYKYVKENFQFDLNYLFYIELRDVFSHAKENIGNWYPFFLKDGEDPGVIDQTTTKTFPDKMKDLIGEKNLFSIFEYPVGSGLKHREYRKFIREKFDLQKMAEFMLSWEFERQKVNLESEWIVEEVSPSVSIAVVHVARTKDIDFTQIDDLIPRMVRSIQYWREVSMFRHYVMASVVRLLDRRDDKPFIKRYTII